MELVEEFQHEGLTVQIFYDDMPDSPRQWDNLSHLALSHENYTLANEADIDFNAYGSWDELQDALKHEYGAKIILPVQGYEHGGLAISVSESHDAWDGGQLGFVYCTAEDIKREYHVQRVSAKLRREIVQVLTSEVEVYNDYINGNVYGYVILDEDGEELDSCWGIYGYDYAVSEAKSIAHYNATQPPKRKIAKYAAEVHA
jgi:hypothetical protein